MSVGSLHTKIFVLRFNAITSRHLLQEIDENVHLAEPDYLPLVPAHLDWHRRRCANQPLKLYLLELTATVMTSLRKLPTLLNHHAKLLARDTQTLAEFLRTP